MRRLRLLPIARNKVAEYTISTVKVGNEYETAVKLENYDYVIVAVNTKIELARMSHKNWCSKCVDKPLYARDVRTGKDTLF